MGRQNILYRTVEGTAPFESAVTARMKCWFLSEIFEICQSCLYVLILYLLFGRLECMNEWNCSSILVLLESCLQTSMTYTIAECTVNKLLMMGTGTSQNM